MPPKITKTNRRAKSEIRIRRLKKGMTIAALAGAAGISTRTLTRHEAAGTWPPYAAARKALEKALSA